MIWKCTALTTLKPKKVYLCLVEGELKKQKYYNRTQSFWNENISNSKTLSSYAWKLKKTKKGTQTLVWKIIRIGVPYTNITKRCSLCLHKRLAILIYPNPSELLTKDRRYFQIVGLYSLMSLNQLKQTFSYSNIRMFL